MKPVALVGLLIPVWLSFAEELIKRKPLTRKGLQRNLYIHCLYIAPVVLVFMVGALGALYNVPVQDWVRANTHISRVINELLRWLEYALVLWFFIAETRYFQRELKRPYWTVGIVAFAFLYISYQIYRFIENLRGHDIHRAWSGLHTRNGK